MGDVSEPTALGNVAAALSARVSEPLSWGSRLQLATDISSLGSTRVVASAGPIPEHVSIEITPEIADLAARLDGRPLHAILGAELDTWDAATRRRALDTVRRYKALGILEDAPPPQPERSAARMATRAGKPSGNESNDTPPPDTTYQLSAAARWVLASGLPTRLEPPGATLELAAYRVLAAEAVRQRIDGLLRTAIAGGTIAADPQARAAAGADELDATRTRISYEQRAAHTLALLDDAGVQTRILKGLAIARCDYDDEQHRTTGDLDLAVRPEQIHLALDTLLAAGGIWEDPEPTPGWLASVAKGATVHLVDPTHRAEIDLHRILVWGPFGVRMAPEELWTPGRTLPIGGIERTTLRREETLLHVCAHLLVLGVPRPAAARDVAQILCHPDLDPDRLLHLAHRWGFTTLLAVAIRHADTELALQPGAHPMQRWAHRYHAPALDRLWLRAGAHHDRIHGIEQLGVLYELGFARRPGSGEARRILIRANLRPAPGTWPSPTARLKQVAAHLIGVRRSS